MIATTPKYAVKFVGYSAYVVTRKRGREVTLATIDFVTGRTALLTGPGDWVTVRGCSDLASFVKCLPDLTSELERLMRDSEQEGNSAALSPIVALSRGENTIHIAKGTVVTEFVRDITRQFAKIQKVLEQAEKIGLSIKRRHYSEYIDGIKRTGLCEVEFHGFALFIDEKLIFKPNYQIRFVRQRAPNTFEIHPAEGGHHEGKESVVTS
jgi:hypothetical protein